MDHEPTTVVEARGLTKTYAATTAVDGIDLTIRTGEIVAVLGPNGAGKTTLIEMMLGLRHPSAGVVQVFGLDPRSAAARSRCGAMLQDTDAPPSLTVRELVELVRRYYPRSLPVAEVLAAAGLDEHADKRAGQLSGGLRQRLSFALAMCGDPALLYLDEPTSAMDVEARRAFWDQVRRYASSGRTVVFSTHHLDEAEALAQRVVVISGGRIVADGTPREIAAQVGGSVVTVTTDAPAEWLRARPGVAGVRPDGAPDTWRITTSEPEGLLRQLFAEDRSVAALQVAPADLEEAFVHLVEAR